MVKVAVAGGSGSVAREVIDQILARNKHQVTILEQRPAESPCVDKHAIEWIQVDYSDKTSLAHVLRGTDVVLCFFTGLDYMNAVRNSKNLIDASIQAGVKRFAPSEWGSRLNWSIPHYRFKDEIREYLEECNSGRIRLEYSLFQPGLFTNYFGFPYSTTKHLSMSPWLVDFDNRRAITVGAGDFSLCLTTVQDMAVVVADALDYEGKWPVDGGIRGTQITMAELIRLGEKLRGPMKVESVSLEDLREGQLKTSWCPLITHPCLPDEHREIISRHVMITFLRSVAQGAWTVSDTWNRLLPDNKHISVEDYLTQVWTGKP
ncbi:hypothetical protein DIS24_g6558 [Lasiodiplodia hormozganensis]|uniref:NmrA-like domain-containing protein n=1 Tax=Lasiodiplodia hormozganensis TaxID=869390 RepID=A0AA39YDP6_9PEZI|nr:hypothetical protein DIS24_g6558 [Lasiodiplodia hormozganensis]